MLHIITHYLMNKVKRNNFFKLTGKLVRKLLVLLRNIDVLLHEFRLNARVRQHSEKNVQILRNTIYLL